MKKNKLMSWMMVLFMALSLCSVRSIVKAEEIELTAAGGTLASGSYILKSDVTLNTNIKVGAGSEVTIDLNGHVLKGTGSGSVIYVQGALILNDTGKDKTGTVTGGKGSNGGGVYVDGASASFTMNGGTISGNTATEHGGGVYVSGGKVTMNGGTISDNTAVQGGGLYTGGNTGNVALLGGTVTGNKDTDANFHFGGVLLNSYGAKTYTIGGNIKIYGNTSANNVDANLVLWDGGAANQDTVAPLKIDAQNPLTEGAEIYVSLYENKTMTTGALTTNGTAADAQYLTGDNIAYKVKLNNNNTADVATDDYLELIKEDHTHSYIYTADGATVTAACANKVCNYNAQDKSLTITAPVSLTYDGGSHDATFGTATSFHGGNLPAISYEYKAEENGTYKTVTDTKKAGYYKASFTVGEGKNAKTGAVEYTVAKRQLTVTGTEAYSKGYDSNATANAAIGTVNGKVADDDVVVSIKSAAFADKNAGGNKTVTVTYEISGTDAGNYIKPEDDSTLKADISPRQLTVAGTSADGKAYDGTTVAVAHMGTVTGIVSGDDVSVTVSSAEFDNINAGNGKTVTVKYTVSGEDSKNYTVPSDDNTSADIEKRLIDVPQAGNGLVYNGTKQTGVVLPKDAFYTLTDYEAVNAGTYTAVARLKDKNNCRWNLAAQTAEDQDISWTIDRAEVTVTADNKEIAVGASVPELTATVKGTIGSDTVSYGFNKIDKPECQGVYSIVPTGDKEQGNYVVTFEKGNLTVTAKPNGETRANPKDLAAALENFRQKKEYQEKIVDLSLLTGGTVSEAAKAKITEIVDYGKKIQFTETSLYLVVRDANGASEKNIGDENDTLIAVTYKMDFSDKKDIQIFRGHEDAEKNVTVDELTGTPNAAGEYATYDVTADTITVVAKGYSTFAVAYNEETVAKTEDFNGVWLYALIGMLSVFGLAGTVILRKRRER